MNDKEKLNKVVTGKVISDIRNKTICVEVFTRASHPLYKKTVNKKTKYHVHDEKNESKVGDIVRITESRPISKTKSWVLAEIIPGKIIKIS